MRPKPRGRETEHGDTLPMRRRAVALAEERLPRRGRAPCSWGANPTTERTQKEQRLANVVVKGHWSPATASLPRYRDRRLNGCLRARATALMQWSSELSPVIFRVY